MIWSFRWASGTDAIYLSLKALNIKKYSVITVANTAIPLHLQLLILN